MPMQRFAVLLLASVAALAEAKNDFLGAYSTRGVRLPTADILSARLRRGAAAFCLRAPPIRCVRMCVCGCVCVCVCVCVCRPRRRPRLLGDEDDC